MALMIGRDPPVRPGASTTSSQPCLTIRMDTPLWLDRQAWPVAPRAVTVDGARLHYVDEGTGPLVVLVHGTPTWSFEWRHVIAALRPAYRVVAMDHLGFGLSDRPAGAG